MRVPALSRTTRECYSHDRVCHPAVEVEQLVEERNQLLNTSTESAATAEKFQAELLQRQTAMQRLEKRAAGLTEEIDTLTADRNQLREQLYGVLSEGQDRTIDVEANERLFESFSRSYVTQSEEIEELKRKLKEFEDQNSQLAEQQNSTETQNQELQSSIVTLEQSVADLSDQKAQLQAELDAANSQIESLKSQLLENAELTEKRIGEISDLRAHWQTRKPKEKNWKLKSAPLMKTIWHKLEL